MARFGLPLFGIGRMLVLATLLSVVLAIAGCGVLRMDVGDLIEPPPGVAVTAPVVSASPATGERAAGVPPAEIVKPEVTAEVSVVPVPSPLVLSGGAGANSTPLGLPPAVYRARISYRGGGPIHVAVRGEGREQVVLDDDDAYEGSVPLAGIPGGSLDTVAGGAWTIEIVKIGTQEGAACNGTGDAVSDMFQAESTGSWRIVHEGEGQFMAVLRCIAGETIVFDGGGPVDETLEVAIPKNWCYWVIKASGPWSLAPAP